MLERSDSSFRGVKRDTDTAGISSVNADSPLVQNCVLTDTDNTPVTRQERSQVLRMRSQRGFRIYITAFWTTWTLRSSKPSLQVRAHYCLKKKCQKWSQTYARPQQKQFSSLESISAYDSEVRLAPNYALHVSSLVKKSGCTKSRNTESDFFNLMYSFRCLVPRPHPVFQCCTLKKREGKCGLRTGLMDWTID